MSKITTAMLEGIIGTIHCGYTIERARVKDGNFSDSDCYGIVLGRHESGNNVTWEFHVEDEISYYFGHYFDDYKKALKDYEERV